MLICLFIELCLLCKKKAMNCVQLEDGAANGMVLLLSLYENLISPSNHLMDYCGHESLNIGFYCTAR